MPRTPLFEPHSHQLLRVDRYGAPKDTRFFIDGKRVSRWVYFDVRHKFGRHDCFRTRIDPKNGNVQHYMTVTKESSNATV